jgi:L-asparaginase II
MAKYPVLISAEGRACERLINAANNKLAVKTGAEAFFVAIIPEQKLGVALKITDGSTRAAECAIAAILVKLGALDPAHPHAQRYINWDIKNAAGLSTGHLRPSAEMRTGYFAIAR